MPRRKKVKITYDRIPENLNVERIYKAMTDFLLAKQYQPIRLRRKEPFDDSQRMALIEKRKKDEYNFCIACFTRSDKDFEF